MPVNFETNQIVFYDEAGLLPPLRHPLVAAYTVNGEVVAALWSAPSVPSSDGALAYHLYEGASHETRAKHHYWAHAGHAGCLLNPRLRMRLGVPNDPEALVGMLFPGPSDVRSDA